MTKKIARYYQSEAFSAAIAALNKGETPYLNMCTGSGKSLVFAMLTDKALRQGGRVLQLVPSKELCEQNYKEAFAYCDDKNALGICCAKLGRFDVNKRAVIATKDSFLRRRATSGAFNLCLIDEAHLCTPDLETGYRKIITSLLRINPRMKIIGATATPYRMDQGMLHEKCAKGEPLFTCEAYRTDIPRMIQEGYLSHIESISGDVEADLAGVAIRGGDYNAEQMGVKFDAIIIDAVRDMFEKFDAYGIQTALVFASTVANAKRILAEYPGDDMRIVYGDMPDRERIHTINWIKNGSGRRIVVNVGVLTTGFDFTALDCVVLLRATKSLGLYIQMVGRVIRAHDDKTRGYVLDYGSNIERHGPIDATIPPKRKARPGDAPKKLCLLCNEPNLLSAKVCKNCLAEFVSDNEEGHYSMRSRADILAAKAKAQEQEYCINNVLYEKSYSRNDGTQMIKMLFADDDGALVHTEYLCLDHPGGIAQKSKAFVMRLFVNPSDFYKLGTVGQSVDNMIVLLQEHPHFFKTIKAITVVPDGKYKRLKSISFS